MKNNILNCKVISLQTEKQSNLYYDNLRNVYKDYLSNATMDRKHHLYLVSEREIKEGDYFYSEFKGDKRILKCDKFAVPFPKDKKIEATTDKSLGYTCESCDGKQINDEEACITCGGRGITGKLPQIPESFIQAYVKANGEIKSVNIEMEEYAVGNYGMSDGEPTIDTRIKTRENNTVICHQSRTYTREEAVKLMNDYRDYSSNFNPGERRLTASEFIEENL